MNYCNGTDPTIVANTQCTVPISVLMASPFNLQIAPAAIYEDIRGIVLLATEQIRVQSSGSLDYDFTLNNILPT